MGTTPNPINLLGGNDMKRKCACCAEMIDIDMDNSNKAICYKDKFYHFNCFLNLCDSKMQSKRTSPMWAEAKANIESLVAETTQKQRIEVAKNELNDWVLQHYDVSFMGKQFYMKLNDIYNGTYKGLAYAISPIELFEEWQYFWKELCATRAKKGIEGERAVNYDLVVLLSRNAEYKKIKEKERIAQEVMKQQRESEMVVNLNSIKTKHRSKNKISDFYQEMNGGVDNE